MERRQLEPCDCGSAQENHGWACRCVDPPSKRTLIKGHDELGPIRGMNAEEVKERDELNIANTTASLRKRVLAELSQSNGHTYRNGDVEHTTFRRTIT